MKMKYTLAALAAMTVAANAATLVNLAGSANNQANFTASAGFSFTTGTFAGDNLLASIDLAGRNTGQPTTVYTLAVYVDGDNNANTYGLGALVGQSTNSTALSGGFAVSTFNFANLALSDNTAYIVRIEDGAGNAINASFGLVNGNSVADSTAFSAGAPVFNATHEAAFTVNTTTAAVPEPSSTALLGLGGLALILRRRK